MQHQSRSRLMALAALLMTFLLVGCGSDDPSLESPAGEATETYNHSDVGFLQDMIPHHEQAIEMAEMVEEQTDRRELIELADNIISSQSTEIDEIRGMLETAEADMDGMDMSGSMGMSQEDMDELSAATGEEFDKLFSMMMIRHHEEAISMADDVLREGENTDVAALAQAIIDEQQAEIDQLKDWLQAWDL